VAADSQNNPTDLQFYTQSPFSRPITQPESWL